MNQYVLNSVFSVRRLCTGAFALVIILLMGWPAFAGENIVLQSMRIKPYDMGYEGFKKLSGNRTKRFILSEMKGTNPLKILKKEKPDLIYAIGADSLYLVKDLNIPVIYSTIFSPERIIKNRNIKGISMSLSKETVLSEIRKRLNFKNIGFIHNFSEDVRELRKAAKANNFNLFLSKSENSGDYIKALKKIKGNIDILLLSPSRALMSTEVIEYLFLTAMENKIMVVAFSGKYAEMGALLSIEPDLYNVGKRAFQLSEIIKSGKKIKRDSLHASKVNVIVNLNVARILNIKLTDNLVKNAHLIK
ncbi:MAG: hypothetical protein GY714_06115 [Desulfobacterales bacterium]|nr:hypothetical protein [Desulfobacterales bacterium]MCP4163868.1 hypothetical protein [Deltaproteobacteria bacterium]